MQDNSLDLYQDIQVAGELDQNFTQHELVNKLLIGAMEKVNLAKQAMKSQAIARKGELISRVMDIIGLLEGALDKNPSNDVAGNLSNLYNYMIRRLFKANIENEPTMLDEVVALLAMIQSGWESLENESEKASSC